MGCSTASRSRSLTADAPPNADEAAQGVALTQRCAEIARTRFARSGAFFDAIMPADAQLAAGLLRGSIVDEEQALIAAYTEAGQEVPHSARQFDSVLKQLRFLGELLALRARIAARRRGAAHCRQPGTNRRCPGALGRCIVHRRRHIECAHLTGRRCCAARCRCACSEIRPPATGTRQATARWEKAVGPRSRA